MDNQYYQAVGWVLAGNRWAWGSQRLGLGWGVVLTSQQPLTQRWPGMFQVIRQRRLGAPGIPGALVLLGSQFTESVIRSH